MANKSLTFNLYGVDKTASKALAGVGGAGANMGRVLSAGAFAAGAALGAATAAAIAFSVQSIKAFGEAEQAQNRLAFVMEKFPSLVGTNVAELQKLNTALQSKTRFEDDAIAAAQSSLALYDLTGDQLKDLTPLMLDYAAATGKDVQTAAEDLGKALMGQGRALKEVGIDFKDAGDPVANYAQLYDGLTEKVSGFAERDAQTVAGRLDQITNQFGDIQEKLGAAFKPGLDLAADVIQNTLLPQLDQIIERVGPKLEAELDELAPRVEDAVEASLPALERLADALPDVLGGIADSITADFGPDGIFGAFNENGTMTLRNNIVSDYFEDATESGYSYQKAMDAFFQWWDLSWDGAADTVENQSAFMKATWSMGLYDMKAAVYAAGMETAGWEFAQGFADGITTNTEAAVLAAERMALAARDKVINTMQIKSPSKVMRDLGAYLPQGLALGIEDDMWRVGAAFERMGSMTARTESTAVTRSGGSLSSRQAREPLTIEVPVVLDGREIARSVYNYDRSLR